MDEIDHLDRIADRMDSFARIPFTGVRVGLDSLLGLVPGIGDALALAPAGYILKEAHRLGAPRPLLTRMALNTGLDALIGTVPLIGDLFDIGFKSNKRNVALLRRHLETQRAALADSPSSEMLSDQA